MITSVNFALYKICYGKTLKNGYFRASRACERTGCSYLNTGFVFYLVVTVLRDIGDPVCRQAGFPKTNK